MRLLFAIFVTVIAMFAIAASAQATTTSVNDTAFQYTGGARWVYEHRSDTFQGDDHYDQTANDSYSTTFSGNQVQIYTAKDTGLGIMAVSIDGGSEVNVDEYAPTRSAQQLLYTSPQLANGNHTLKVRVTGTKNPSAAHAFISADRVDVTTNPAPTVTLNANPSSITSGQNSTLTWSSTNATSCSAPWTTQTGVSGSQSVSPTSTTSYTVTCTGAGGQGSASTTVTVNSTQTTIRTANFEPGGTFFDASNGTVTYVTNFAHNGVGSAEIPVAASTINRGWFWQNPSNYCDGSGTNDINTFAPVGSNRDIKADYYITNPNGMQGVRVLALSYDFGDCLPTEPHGSLVGVDVTAGSAFAHAANYGGDCAGCNEFHTTSLPVPANQWVNIELKVHVARDNTGSIQLLVNGVSTPVVNGPTLTTAWGNYNEIQWGAGWAEPGTVNQNEWLDDTTLSSY